MQLHPTPGSLILGYTPQPYLAPVWPTIRRALQQGQLEFDVPRDREARYLADKCLRATQPRRRAMSWRRFMRRTAQLGAWLGSVFHIDNDFPSPSDCDQGGPAVPAGR